MVTLIHGVNKLSRDDVAGQTLCDIKADYDDALAIPANVTVKVNGLAVTDLSRTANDGDVVEFVKAAGEKGQL